MFPKVWFLDQRINFTWERHRCPRSRARLIDPLHQEPWVWDPAMWAAQSSRDDTDVPQLQSHIHRAPLSLSLISGTGLVWHTPQNTARQSLFSYSASGNDGLFFFLSLAQGLANCSLQVTVCINKVLLEHIHTHSFTYCLSLPLALQWQNHIVVTQTVQPW